MANGTATRRATVALVGAATLLMALVVWPLWEPLLVAAVLAGVLEPLYERVLPRFGGRRSLLAALFTSGTVLLILVPLGALALVAIREAFAIAATVRETLASDGLSGLIAKAPDPLEGWLRQIQKVLPARIDEARSQVAAGGRWAIDTLSGTLSAVAHFAFSLAMMLIAFFFLLRDGRALVGWLAEATPLPPHRVHGLMREFRTMARSVLGANLVTGAVQAAVATGGYLLARAPSPVFFGLLTLFASLIPSVGTALVTFPVAGIMLFLGHRWAALFLILWALFVVGLVDNLLRPLLIQGTGARLHGGLVFFSLIGGAAAFGGAGLFLGPLVLTFFLAAVRISHPGHDELVNRRDGSRHNGRVIASMPEPLPPPARLSARTAVRYGMPLREGGSLPALVEADDGRLYVAKFVGAGQGSRRAGGGDHRGDARARGRTPRPGARHARGGRRVRADGRRIPRSGICSRPAPVSISGWATCPGRWDSIRRRASPSPVPWPRGWSPSTPLR